MRTLVFALLLSATGCAHEELGDLAADRRDWETARVEYDRAAMWDDSEDLLEKQELARTLVINERLEQARSCAVMHRWRCVKKAAEQALEVSENAETRARTYLGFATYHLGGECDGELRAAVRSALTEASRLVAAHATGDAFELLDLAAGVDAVCAPEMLEVRAFQRRERQRMAVELAYTCMQNADWPCVRATVDQALELDSDHAEAQAISILTEQAVSHSRSPSDPDLVRAGASAVEIATGLRKERHDPEAFALLELLVAADPQKQPLLVAERDSFAAEHAPRLWREHCAYCHGTDGRAQTGVGRRKQMEDMTGADWQRQRSDAQLAATIKYGRPHRFSQLTPPETIALVAHIRALGAQ